MGTSQAKRAKTHARIVRIASARLREAGLDGVSVADLMRDAILTLGSLVGALQLARVVTDEALSAEILLAVRAGLS